MPTPLHILQAQVLEQKTRIPSLYGDVDFSIVPERFAGTLADKSMLPARFSRKYRGAIVADQERVQRALAYTMLGDTVADAYAALMPKYGFRRLIDMLSTACEKGLDAVPDAPQELMDFIHAMERVPDWVDMELVQEGARVSRNQMATLVPFAIRGTFVATFMNKYSGLPMALTGALSSESSVQRVKETASFFTTATLPGALGRYGAGFKAAALVRLMHSMVRFNILKRSKKWDVNVYGIPIPQVDQMPAGTIPAFTMAFNLVRQRRKQFNKRERAVVELCRYQSYLLGLPEDLLPESPQGIVDTMLTYAGTLRDGYDDETCGELVRTTMGAYLPTDKSLKGQIYNRFEKSFSKVFFSRVFLADYERSRAEMMGVKPTALDYALFAATSAFVMPQMLATRVIQDIPVANRLLDKLLIRRIDDLLVEYGHAEYTTDPSRYKEVPAAQHRPA